MKKLIYIAIALLFCTTAYAGKTVTYYQPETWNSARVVYELTDCHTIVWEEFYWVIQMDINDWVRSYPKREQGKLSTLVAWAVMESATANWRCS